MEEIEENILKQNGEVGSQIEPPLLLSLQTLTSMECAAQEQIAWSDSANPQPVDILSTRILYPKDTVGIVSRICAPRVCFKDLSKQTLIPKECAAQEQIAWGDSATTIRYPCRLRSSEVSLGFRITVHVDLGSLWNPGATVKALVSGSPLPTLRIYIGDMRKDGFEDMRAEDVFQGSARGCHRRFATGIQDNRQSITIIKIP
ncbi:hypothetical protein Ddc_15045 [Ditylenchus destructor]|nr:hypothetical protein Ddc_15045 [Ditylenchus destructor]